LTTPATPRKRKTKPTLPKLIQKYYADLGDLAHQNVMYEMGTRPAFHALFAAAGKEAGWTLIAEHEKKVNGRLIRRLRQPPPQPHCHRHEQQLRRPLAFRRHNAAGLPHGGSSFTILRADVARRCYNPFVRGRRADLAAWPF
jgi:hypothetical protein